MLSVLKMLPRLNKTGSHTFLRRHVAQPVRLTLRPERRMAAVELGICAAVVVVLVEGSKNSSKKEEREGSRSPLSPQWVQRAVADN